MPIVIRLDVELAKRKKAIRSNALEARCEVLDCQPGDLLEWVRRRSGCARPRVVVGVLRRRRPWLLGAGVQLRAPHRPWHRPLLRLSTGGIMRNPTSPAGPLPWRTR